MQPCLVTAAASGLGYFDDALSIVFGSADWSVICYQSHQNLLDLLNTPNYVNYIDRIFESFHTELYLIGITFAFKVRFLSTSSSSPSSSFSGSFLLDISSSDHFSLSLFFLFPIIYLVGRFWLHTSFFSLGFTWKL